MRPTKPSNVLNQDPSQSFSEGQLPRSCAFGMASAHIRGIKVRERGGKRTYSSHSKSNFTTISVSRTTAAYMAPVSASCPSHTLHIWVRTLQHRAAASVPWCGRCRGMQSSSWHAQGLRLHSAPHNSCPTSLSEHMEHATSISLYNPIR